MNKKENFKELKQLLEELKTDNRNVYLLRYYRLYLDGSYTNEEVYKTLLKKLDYALSRNGKNKDVSLLSLSKDYFFRFVETEFELSQNQAKKAIKEVFEKETFFYNKIVNELLHFQD